MSRKSDTKNCTKYTPRFCAIKKLCKAIQPYTAHYWQQLIKSLCKHEASPQRNNKSTLGRNCKFGIRTFPTLVNTKEDCTGYKNGCCKEKTAYK